MEKLLCVTDIYGMALGPNTVVFLGEAESSTEFEQMFGSSAQRAPKRPSEPPYDYRTEGALIPLHGINYECSRLTL